jgi:plastocyanin
LLLAGLGLVVVGLMGMSLQVTAGGWGEWRGMHGGPMMEWGGPGDTSSRGTPPIGGASTVEVEATEFAFEPNRVVTGAGEVNIALVNRGTVLHDLTIPALGVHLAAGRGETTTIGLSGLIRGEYPILCTVPGHAEAGMIGVLVVEGP